MKQTIVAAMTAVLGLAAGGAHATDIGVSVQISQPGVYGRVDIGRFPQPAVIVAQPVIVARPVVVSPQPVYMWVPPGHRKKWSKHCREYRACGVPVYFVDHRWYDAHVMPARYDDRRHDDWRDDDRGPPRGYDDRRPDRGDDDRGRGNGHGKGHGPKGHGPRD